MQNCLYAILSSALAGADTKPLYAPGRPPNTHPNQYVESDPACPRLECTPDIYDWLHPQERFPTVAITIDSKNVSAAMVTIWNLQTAISCVFLVGLSFFGIFSLHIFASRNGLLEHFLNAIDKRKLPSGLPLQPITTNGRFPKVDWQIMAPAVFMLTFTENLAHPDTTLAGFLFLGAWAPAWALIILESLRKCNQGTLAAQ